jgi:hypothetical protein
MYYLFGVTIGGDGVAVCESFAGSFSPSQAWREAGRLVRSGFFALAFVRDDSGRVVMLRDPDRDLFW